MVSSDPALPVPETRARSLAYVSGRKWMSQAALGLLVAGLLYFSFRGVRLASIWETLRRMHLWQIALLLSLDALIHVLFGVRWWALVRVENRRATLVDAISVRLSAFGLSYFTVGPQVGGEPLLVFHLRRRHMSTFARATATVVLDKLLELFANFVFLVMGLGALMQSGILQAAGPAQTVGLVALFALGAWPFAHILLLRGNHHPLSEALRIHPVVGRPENQFGRYVRVSEHLVGRFCRRRPRILAAVLAVSLCACLLAVIEYALITSFLGIRLSLPQTVSAWTAGWLSFLMPVPGGLGALEASQVVALGAFGAAVDVAIGVSLVMRGRDILFGGAGLVLALNSLRSAKSKTL